MTPTLRRKVLAEWRGYREPEAPRPVVSLADAVAPTMKSLGLKDLMDEARVIAAWRNIVGDFIATHSAPVRLTGGTLTVRVLQPSLRFELERQWRGTILEKLRASFGGRIVRQITFRV
jgi:predicted nucleic acid-binding Zn ribbon protein